MKNTNQNVINEENKKNKQVVKRKRKKHIKLQRTVFILCFILFTSTLVASNLSTILAWVGFGSDANFQEDLSVNKKFQKLSIKETIYDNLSTDINFSNQNVINVLFFGEDKDSGRLDDYATFRPDSVILISVNLETKIMHLISIPRDTRIPIYGRGGSDKINTCFMYGAIDKETPEEIFQGGIDCLEGTVSDLFGGIPINYYVGVDMDGVPQIIDTIGGVKVDVLEDIYMPDGSLYIPEGEKVLTGAEFLFYARNREYAMGDLERVEVQRMLLKDLFSQMTSADNIMKMPKAISQTFDIIMTDISFKQATSLALTLKDFNVDNIKTATIPCYLNGSGYVNVDEYALVDFIEEHFGE